MCRALTRAREIEAGRTMIPGNFTGKFSRLSKFKPHENPPPINIRLTAAAAAAQLTAHFRRFLNFSKHLNTPGRRRPLIHLSLPFSAHHQSDFKPGWIFALKQRIIFKREFCHVLCCPSRFVTRSGAEKIHSRSVARSCRAARSIKL